MELRLCRFSVEPAKPVRVWPARLGSLYHLYQVGIWFRQVATLTYLEYLVDM